MMTRRATALCTEQKLRQALEELKHTKETCSQLLRERDESEIEIQKIIARNTQLKSELSQLHAQHVDVLQHQENLNETISCYDQQYSSYERTLQRITDLEKELSIARYSSPSPRKWHFNITAVSLTGRPERFRAPWTKNDRRNIHKHMPYILYYMKC
ncbi:hypothetical protein ACJJTC_014392 [Scirpophaga incertulas]